MGVVSLSWLPDASLSMRQLSASNQNCRLQHFVPTPTPRTPAMMLSFLDFATLQHGEPSARWAVVLACAIGHYFQKNQHRTLLLHYLLNFGLRF